MRMSGRRRPRWWRGGSSRLGWGGVGRAGSAGAGGVALGDLVGGLKGWKTTPPVTPVTPVVACDPSDPAEPSVTPVVSVTGSLAAAAGEVESVAAHALWRLGEVEVNASLAWVGRLRTVLDRAEVALVGEAVGRGLAKDEGMSAVDRVVAAEGAVAPVPDPRRVAQVVKVADACRGASGPTDATAGADAGVTGVTGVAGAAVMPGAEVFAAAFTSGVMGVEKGGMIARFAADLQKVRSAATRRADALLALVGAGVAPTSTPTPTPSSTPTLTPSLTPTSARGAALGAAVDGSPDDEAGEPEPEARPVPALQATDRHSPVARTVGTVRMVRRWGTAPRSWS